MITPFYKEEGITLYCGNNVDILPQLPRVDLVVTSPPYDSLRDYCGDCSFDFKTSAQVLCERLAPGGVIVWIVGDQVVDGSETGTSFKQALFFKEQCGLNLHDTMIYFKDACTFPDALRYTASFEYMFILTNGKPKTVNLINDRQNRWGGSKYFGIVRKRGKNGTLFTNPKSADAAVKAVGTRMNVWRVMCGYLLSTPDKIAYQHPAIFPDALAKDHILSWSNPGDVILDPFAGSGTTLKMAKETGRKAIGIEISEEYCKIAVQRLRQEVLALQGINNERVNT